MPRKGLGIPWPPGQFAIYHGYEKAKKSAFVHKFAEQSFEQVAHASDFRPPKYMAMFYIGVKKSRKTAFDAQYLFAYFGCGRPQPL
ncbi:hypothetical protein [Pseudorhodobacter antarcticus]|jgi:hypothetical protein|uniref:hypothetical protein n=1 Tax=Pseudorhodobacter antarcticus TaxID=1077947 RepID=UPI00067B635B|nr:hypothetical protein [Pseudorhodobacter antarcticus]